MNQTPSDDDDDMERRFQRGLDDGGGPSEAVRRAILEHANQMAAEYANRRPKRQRPNPRFVRYTIFGTLAAAVFAGLLVVPLLPTPTVRERGSEPPPLSTAAPQAPINASQPVEPPHSESTGTVAVAPRFTAGALKPKSAAPAASNGSAVQAKSAISEDAVRPAAPALSESRAFAGGAAALSSASPVSGRIRASSAERVELLQRAAIAGDLAVVNSLLNGSLDVDGRDPSGRTPLMLAIQNGHAEVVEVLLAHGADVNAVDATGVRPMQMAHTEGNQNIIEALSRAGAR